MGRKHFYDDDDDDLCFWQHPIQVRLWSLGRGMAKLVKTVRCYLFHRHHHHQITSSSPSLWNGKDSQDCQVKEKSPPSCYMQHYTHRDFHDDNCHGHTNQMMMMTREQKVTIHDG